MGIFLTNGGVMAMKSGMKRREVTVTGTPDNEITSGMVSCLPEVVHSRSRDRTLRRVVPVLYWLLLVSGTAYSLKLPFFDKNAENSGSENIEIFDWFFSESYAHNGFQYAYPASSSVTVAKGNAHGGRYALQFDLDPDDYSGGSICLGDRVYNLKPFFRKGTLQFWAKGAAGNEKAWVALVDDEKSDGHKTVVRLEIGWFGPVTTDWTLFSIPLEKFGERGVFWDAKEQREVDDAFDWERVAEFRIEVKKGDNSTFRLWVDDVVIVKSLR